MPRSRLESALSLAAAFALAHLITGTTSAQSVWSGFSFTFDRPPTGSSSAEANQDRITDNVWLTRDSTEGVFNIRKESSYDKGTFQAPADTRWATSINNPGDTIAATNWQNLDFTFWRQAYGGQILSNIVGRNTVVHLLTDDIYLDLRFTDWGGSAGGFSYIRAVAPDPQPSATGDYNGNGVVDAADYVVWRDTLTQMVTAPGSGADGNMSGTVDEPDYDFWRARFGNTVPAPVGNALAPATAVPEPTAAIIAGMIALHVSGCRRMWSRWK